MWQPDQLQLAIMRELAGSSYAWGARSSYTDIAERLGVDEETVRNRLRRMQEYGLLRGWRVMVNPVLFGREASIFQLELDEEERKDNVIPQLKLLEGIVLINNFYGKSLQVALYHEGEDGLAKGAEAIRSTGGGRTTLSWKMNLPDCDQRMTRTDWEIVGLLLKDAEKKPSEVAHELRISTRTAKRRMDKLRGSLAFFVQPVLDLRKARGASCHLVVVCSRDKKRTVDKLIVSKFDRIVYRYTDSNTHSIFTIPSANVAECQEISKWVRNQDGVELVKSDIYQEQIPVYEWLEKEVKRQISTMQNARP